uniref:Uncharacterized protein n=1 Tax=Nymphaea colorata TaxID=210225 RepID=A0A5K0YEL5_9MAGN|nr:unnamed protein product [Nymphaea colorata]
MGMLTNVAQNLQKRSSRSREDMKDGHFAVLATYEGNSKKFSVPLSYLSNPAFVRLLDEAEEEYGFYQPSILTVPCHPSELECILAGEKKSQRRDSFSNGFFKSPW